MTEDASQKQEQGQPPLPPVLELLWGRRERGKRGPRPGLSADAIVETAVRIADAEGLEAISMSRVAAELGFTTMSLYRHVTSKDELLQLMFNASALGAESIVLAGEGWRAKMRHWSALQRDVLDRHPWLTQLPMPGPPLAPNSMHFVEHALAALDETDLADAEKLRVIGLLASYSLADARFAHDAARAMAAAKTTDSGDGDVPGPPPAFEDLLRELVDEQTYPHLYRLAWTPEPEAPRLSEREEFLAGVDLILDGVQARIDRGGAAR